MFIRNGIPRVIGSVHEDASIGGENTVSVVQSGGTLPWRLRFYALLGSQRVQIGSVRTFAATTDRLVAVISVPGARGFAVDGSATDPNSNESIEVHFEGMQCIGGPFGVHAIPGFSVDGARSYRLLAGVNGAVTVTGQVWGWAAFATAPGATVAASAGPALALGPAPVPTNGSVRGDARGIMAPVSTWTFTGTSGYLIEYTPPAGVFDG
jgi:hypothetical protein